MNIVERYLGKVVFLHSLVVLLVLLLIMGFVELMFQLSTTGRGYTALYAFIFVGYKLPVFAYEVFPVALLIGSLIGLGSLANHSELTVLRATGWSVRRVFIGVMKTILLVWLIFTLLGEWLAPMAEVKAQQLRAEMKNQRITIGNSKDFWMKDEGRFIHVQRILSEKRMIGLEIFYVDEFELKAKLYAKSAEFTDKGWLLKGIKTTNIDWQDSSFQTEGDVFKYLGLKHEKEKTRLEQLPVTPEMLRKLRVETRYMSMTDLEEYIGFLNENGLDAEPYKLAFWRKVVSPLALVGMIALVFPLIFGSQRAVSMGQRIFVGIVIGLGFHMLNQIFGNLSVVYQMPTIIGAAAPSIILILIAFALFRRVR